MGKIKSIKKLAQVYKDWTYKDYNIWNCLWNKSQLILNYCYKKYWEKAMEKYSNACFTFDYELRKLN